MSQVILFPHQKLSINKLASALPIPRLSGLTQDELLVATCEARDQMAAVAEGLERIQVRLAEQLAR